MKLINRPQYIEKIKPFIGKGLIIVLTGQRQVGKSLRPKPHTSASEMPVVLPENL